ncbi:single-stranded DNA-binding protein, partial [Escherichia coli]|nr:single-stranded DNA-binding protein [Escherichia coli]
GMMLYVEGRMRNNKGKGKDGKRRSKKEIVIEKNGEMQMLRGAGPRNTSAEGQGGIENHDEPPFPDMNDYPQ